MEEVDEGGEENMEGGEAVTGGPVGRKVKGAGGTASVNACWEDDGEEVRKEVLSFTGSGGMLAQTGNMACLIQEDLISMK